jgi:hypothetical protein
MLELNPCTSTRRDFVKQAIATGIVLAAGSARSFAGGASPILLNQVGFLPFGSKFCLMNSSVAVPFTLVQSDTGQVVFQGTMRVLQGDFGIFAIGEFSALMTEGTYVLQANGTRSQPFEIASDVYLDFVRNGVDYFSKQRCGNSTTGYNAPCHLDDGRRLDNNAHQNVVGGWHDACDLRKWVDATIYGMVGLARLLDYFSDSTVDQSTIVEEMRWGNLYFRNMQEPAGYLMNYCGGDDGNYFTDNIISTADDRPIHTEPTALPAQFHFVAAQAALFRYVQGIDAAYAHGCLAAAVRCSNWLSTSRTPTAAPTLASAVMASTQMFITTQDTAYRDQAVAYANQLLSLLEQSASVRGFFHSDLNIVEPYRDAQNGNLPILALCDLLENFPTHPMASTWQSALALHCNFLQSMADRSGLGIVPYGLYAAGDPGGNRRIGSYWYRWFMEISGTAAAEQWWVGMNANLASSGIGLSRAGTLLNTPAYSSLAQRQLDWILGCNPFAASTVIGAGYNQPTLYRTSAFKPNTPLINGAVMNGIGGTVMDQPDIADGTYHTCEYWTPMVAYTTWLMAELESSAAS